MYRTFARSRPALMLRRMRGRFGMLAPRMTVRAHIPWHWRVLAILLMLTAATLLASWIYGVGRGLTGNDKPPAEQEVSALRERVQSLETEAERNQGNNSGSEASLQIERTAQQQLGEQVKRLEIENGRLREDLAAFENLASGQTKNETVSLGRLQVEPDPATAGRYRYRVLVSAPASHPDMDFKGRLQLIASILQDGKAAMVNIPDGATADAQRFALAFKYFRRIEGEFSLPVNSVLKKLEVRLMQGNAVVASQQTVI